MNFFYVFPVFILLSLFSCNKNDKNISEYSVSNQDSVVSQQVIEKSNDINLAPVQSGVPKFGIAKADAFVVKAKGYFEEIADANERGNAGEVLKLQERAVEIDTEYQAVKKLLNVSQQKQLADWYMKLVKAASK